MSFTIPKPDKTTIRELHPKLLTDWSARFAIEKEYSDLVHQRNMVDTLKPDEKRNMTPVAIHSGRAGGIIEQANGLLMSIPTFKAQASGHSQDDKADSDQVERTCAALFQRELLATDFFPAIGRDVLTYSRAFIKAMPLPSVWTVQQGYPVRKKTEKPGDYLARVRSWKDTEAQFPFVIQHIPVTNILPLLDSSDNALCTIEEKLVPAYIIADEMKHGPTKADISAGRIQWYDLLTCIEYTDPEYVWYGLTGRSPMVGTGGTLVPGTFNTGPDYEELRVWKHNLGRCPVVMIPGMKTELQDKEGRYKSFLADAKESLEGYDIATSRLATIMWAYYLPSYEWKQAESSAVYQGRERPVLKVNLGGVTATYSDEELKVLPYPENLPDSLLLMQTMDDNIQRHTLEDVLYGRVAGSAPAFQVNLRINVAKSKLLPLAQHMAQGITAVMDLFLRGVVGLGESVTIAGETITPAQAKKALGRVTANIEPKSPADRASDFGTAKMAQEFGLDDAWIMENILNIEDPATRKLAKMVQDLEKTPVAQEKLLLDALTHLDILTEADEFEDMGGIDMSGLSPELGAAIQQVMGQQAEGLGRGPFPPGGAPQTLAPRGLLSEKEQPQPGTPQVSTAQGGSLGY
jgi:hypothetical protein